MKNTLEKIKKIYRMVINDLKDIKCFKTLFPIDDNGRNILLYKVNNTQFYKSKIFYPNVLIFNGKKTIRPLNETTLSLKDVSLKNNNMDLLTVNKKDTNPYFFFIYNTENYYHFIYDTLPYLISFFKLKKEIPELKLLMNYPNNEKNTQYRFVNEFLNILSITEKDISIVDPTVRYGTVYISNSYTHDGKSNLPPRNEIYDFYNEIITKVKNNNNNNSELPKKIYISRRTWVSKDVTNIGTNYTTKRKMINEDDVVKYFNSMGFIEVFTENLNTEEKILLFNSAEHIVGPIGGGLSNVLFSNKKTKLHVLNSPTFFDVNYRFIYSFKNVDYNIINISKHTEVGDIKKFMRVKFDGGVGEIIDINGDNVTIIYSDNDVSGWCVDVTYKTQIKKISDVQKLDEGLNSEWEINLEKLKQIIC
jgi:hypothetical protein